jgi:hypothetical protein
MRYIAQYVENIELHGVLLQNTDGDTARGLSPISGPPSQSQDPAWAQKSVAISEAASGRRSAAPRGCKCVMVKFVDVE